MAQIIGVVFKNEEEKENMIKFLLENKDMIEKMRLEEKFYPYHNSNPLKNEELSLYFENEPNIRNILGFTGIAIPTYIFNLCIWIVVKSSTSDINNYILYNDRKIFITYEKNNKNAILVNREGIRIEKEEPFSFKNIFTKSKKNNATHALFSELNTRWKGYQQN